MVVVNTVINGKQCGRGNDTAHYDITVNILTREDANDIEVQYAKFVESVLKNAMVVTANKIIKQEEIKGEP
jgi:hypothetical protein